MSLLLAMLLQVGPAPGALDKPASPLPRELRERPARREPPPPIAELPAPLPCPEDIAGAESRVASARGLALAAANHCLGKALAASERWGEAESAFLAALAATPAAHATVRGRLGAMAGNAALAAGANERALGLFDAALLAASGDSPLAGAIQLDRARALVTLKRNDEAAAALAAARTALPANAEAWLLSATLSRRQSRLEEAQGQIEKAAALLPQDPEIGLEAGVIAMLAGREDAARKSWQSVLAAAPQGAAAETARGYLAQIGESATKAP